MKAFKMIGATAAAALVLLTSCLGETKNTLNTASFAVGGTSDKTYKTILNTPLGPIYSPAIASKVIDDACYVVGFEIDSDNPENANGAATANGYSTATISSLDEISKGNAIFYNVPDTAKLLDKEIALTNAGLLQYGVYVYGYLFLGGAYNGLKEQKNAWYLYWDRSKEPVTVDGVPTYSLFLRSTKLVDGTGTTATSLGDTRAYNVKAVVDAVNKAEASKGSTAFNLKINYLNNINEKDSTDLTWKSFPIKFEVVKES